MNISLQILNLVPKEAFFMLKCASFVPQITKLLINKGKWLSVLKTINYSVSRRLIVQVLKIKNIIGLFYRRIRFYIAERGGITRQKRRVIPEEGRFILIKAMPRCGA